MLESSYALRARWVMPIAAPPIEGGVVTIEAGRIVGVGRGIEGCDSSPKLIDLGDVALLPGFVNAHTHLEFSDLATPLGESGIGLCDWIPLVVAERRRADRDPEQAVRAGIAESARCGVTSLGEIAQVDWSRAAIESLPLAVNVYLELIGLAADRIDELCQGGRELCARTASLGNRWRTGVSPHAPYSVHRDVVRALAGLPLAMHLAESREEVELLESASGPMREMLVKFGAWREEAFGGRRPLEYLQAMCGRGTSHGERERYHQATALIVHGNYLGGEEHDFLQNAPRPMWVVYCPRTHDYFNHSPYPLAEMLRRKIPVAIGTDSRASNPDLSVLAELRFVAARFPDVPAEQVLRMGTLEGAAALMREGECGSLEIGKAADLAAVELAPREAEGLSPYEQVLHSAGDVVATIAAGQVVYERRGLIGGGALG
jgi:cytosine/adenosine deaminase-related metal-dependent hydrolase